MVQGTIEFQKKLTIAIASISGFPSVVQSWTIMNSY